MPQLGMDFASQEIQIPSFTIPTEYDFTLPLMGMMEASSKINSNYYNWEATMSAGNNTVDSPSYMANFSILADSPIKLLSFSTEGNLIITVLINKWNYISYLTQEKYYINYMFFFFFFFLKELQNSQAHQRQLRNSRLTVP